MRVTTDFWVSALIRRAFDTGGFAAVLRRGAAEAGAVFVLARGRMGESALYGPAPQASYDEGRPADRLFQCLVENADGDDIDKRIERETRFDSDLWLVEVEASETFVSEALGLTRP